MPHSVGDNETPHAHQCHRQHSAERRFERVNLRGSARDRRNVAVDGQSVVASAMTSSAACAKSQSQRARCKTVEKCASPAAKVAVNKRRDDDFHATNADFDANDVQRSVVAQQQPPFASVNTVGADRTAAMTHDTNCASPM